LADSSRTETGGRLLKCEQSSNGNEFLHVS
jgi:hypothetical protein